MENMFLSIDGIEIEDLEEGITPPMRKNLAYLSG